VPSGGTGATHQSTSTPTSLPGIRSWKSRIRRDHRVKYADAPSPYQSPSAVADSPHRGIPPLKFGVQKTMMVGRGPVPVVFPRVHPLRSAVAYHEISKLSRRRSHAGCCTCGSLERSNSGRYPKEPRGESDGLDRPAKTRRRLCRHNAGATLELNKIECKVGPLQQVASYASASSTPSAQPCRCQKRHWRTFDAPRSPRPNRHGR
jgi:hypothetical protein